MVRTPHACQHATRLRRELARRETNWPHLSHGAGLHSRMPTPNPVEEPSRRHHPPPRLRRHRRPAPTHLTTGVIGGSSFPRPRRRITTKAALPATVVPPTSVPLKITAAVPLRRQGGGPLAGPRHRRRNGRWHGGGLGCCSGPIINALVSANDPAPAINLDVILCDKSISVVGRRYRPGRAGASCRGGLGS
jgi:hypothetical protein